MVADPARPGLENCHFSFVFPLRDILFETALYGEPPRRCGVDDLAIEAYNDFGIVGQQRAAFRRFVAALGLQPRAIARGDLRS